jgi:hypothetical protein
MQHAANENYAHQCDPQQPKTRAPRPKAEVHRPDPKKIFDGIANEKPPAKKPPAKKPSAKKPPAKKRQVRRRMQRTDKPR